MFGTFGRAKLLLSRFALPNISASSPEFVGEIEVRELGENEILSRGLNAD